MQEPKKYDEVDWPHIVPAGYLRNFAEGSWIMRHHLESGRVKKRPVKKVGTRFRFYSRTRPRTGERIDDVEWALSLLDNKVETVRFAEQRFPFSELDRSTIAQFAGAQHVRGPKWRKQHAGLISRFAEELEIEGLETLTPIANQVVKPRLMREAERLGSATAALKDMQKWLVAESAYFFAMHWTLIKFNRPLLATCDHPVVLWPATMDARPLVAGDGTGLQNAIEVRYPLTSTLCLLMTWLDEPDAPEIVRGSRQMALNINGFTQAEAELEWFSVPEINPPMPSERSQLLPLSPAIYPRYNLAYVERSVRRAAGVQYARDTAKQPLVQHPTFPALQLNFRSGSS